MGEISSCGTRYLGGSGSALISVWVCDAAADAAEVAPDASMHRGNVAVETAATGEQVHDRIARALDSLGG